MSENPSASDIIGEITSGIVADIQPQAEPAPESEAVLPDVATMLADPAELEDESEGLPESDEEDGDEQPSDGYAEVKVIDDELQAEFAVLDDDGELEIPNIKIRYKANGRDREERLDQVVKLAQMGVYNADRQDKIRQVETHAQQVQARVEEYENVLRTREKQIERLLTDDNYLYEVRDRYAEHNSPEERARRAEEQVHEVRAEAQMSEVRRVGSAFFNGEVAPALTLLEQHLPNVSKEEMAERTMRQLQSHYRKGPRGVMYLPPESHDALRDYLVNDLAVWAQGQNQLRGGAATSKKDAQDVVEKAQIESQKAKRVVGKKTRPVGRAAAGKTRAKPKEINNMNDAMASALDGVFASVRNN